MRIFLFRKGFISTLFKDFSFEMVFWFFKNRNNYSVINVHGLWNLGSILPFFIRNNAIKIITVHGFLDNYVLNDSKYLKRIFWFLFQKRCFKNASLIHAISRNEFEFLIKIFPKFKHKIVLIPNGLYAPDSFNKVDFKFKSKIDIFIKDKTFVFLFLSRISKKKGLDILIPAFNLLQEKNSNIKLIVAGPSGDYSDELLDAIKLNSDILLLPSCIEWSKDYLFQQSDAFVLPSYSEGFSIAALEAISYGKPSVFSHFIGFSDDLLRYNAALISDTTVLSLFEKMNEVFINANLRKTLTLNSKELFNDRFKMDKIGNLFLDQIYGLLHEK
jgi:glycosyltransferase involved in cell wall biosynthesis